MPAGSISTRLKTISLATKGLSNPNAHTTRLWR